VTGDERKIDQMLASALRGEAAAWPSDWSDSQLAPRVVERIAYHGIAGLIADLAPQLSDWPASVLTPVREQGIALAMWELRHKAVLGPLLEAFAEKNMVALLLKGTAVAYDLYPSPASRARGDSDLLVAASKLVNARAIFTRLGYRRQSPDEAIADDLALQEVWTLTCDAGTQHHFDLHWQLLNAPALRGVLAFGDCAANPLPLPQLGPNARSMNRVLTLLHTCVHRAMHLTSPYFVDGVTYYGGDRLIWAKDIDLLAGALSGAEWAKFSALAVYQGVATVSLDGLQMAQRLLGTGIPQEVVETLGSVEEEQASTYLLSSGQAQRAWKDLLTIRGRTRKFAYLAARALPSASFMRAKYPGLDRRPLTLLYLRRMFDLVRSRPGRGGRA